MLSASNIIKLYQAIFNRIWGVHHEISRQFRFKIRRRKDKYAWAYPGYEASALGTSEKMWEVSVTRDITREQPEACFPLGWETLLHLLVKSCNKCHKCHKVMAFQLCKPLDLFKPNQSNSQNSQNSQNSLCRMHILDRQAGIWRYHMVSMDTSTADDSTYICI